MIAACRPFWLALCTPLFLLAVCPSVQAQRYTIDFNRNWRFRQGAFLSSAQEYPPPLAVWTFARGMEGWSETTRNTHLSASQGILDVRYQGPAPQFNSPAISVGGPVDLRLRVKCQQGGELVVYWATSEQGEQEYGPTQRATTRVTPSNVWQEVTLALSTTATITRLRIDPPESAGRLALEQVSLVKIIDPVTAGEQISLAAFDDTTWQTVRLPHDWAIAGPFDPDGDGHTGKLPWRDQGWYRKVFPLEVTDTGRRVYLNFDGVMAQPRIYVNGQVAGAWDYGYNSFLIDITDFVRCGQENTVAVHVDTRRHGSRWYPGAGIYRKVRLQLTDPVHVTRGGLFVTTPTMDTENAQVRIATEVVNHTAHHETVTITTQIQNPQERLVTRANMYGKLSAGQAKTFVQTLTVPNPQRWDIEHPHLYTAVCTVKRQGQACDRATTTFGIRTVSFNAEDGLLLNGRRVPLQGVNLHHDHGPLGAAFFTRAMERQLEIMKDMGCNAIRTSHNIAAPELLDLCDRMGLLVYNEVFDKWDATADRVRGEDLLAYGHKQIRNFCRRDRNHPSVVLWSIGNEIPYVLRNESGRAPAEVEAMVGFFRQYDPTRPVTLACHMLQGLKGGILDTLDIQSWNYGRKYLKAKQQYPNRPSICAESASALSTRGFYELPLVQNKTAFSAALQVDSYDRNAASWADIPDVDFAGLQRHPFCAGEFVWTGFDYLGEPTPYNSAMVKDGRISQQQMPRSSYFGIVDLCGIPKDRYYLYRSLWAPDKTTLHILPHWNWPEHIGKNVPVYVYTNGDSAELFLNGESLGTRTKKTDLPPDNADYYAVLDSYRLRWDNVTYTPGELKVVAYRQGQKIGEAFKKTAGPCATLRLTPDRRQLAASGEDLAYVLVEAIDAQGLLCPLAHHRIHIEITGPGVLAGIGNGNPLGLDRFSDNTHTLFFGKAMLILRTTDIPGTIQILVESTELPSASVVLASRSG
ncbi:glycoside hydrolase family 2 TIM barrel-domain containing protein [Planctomycetota bacterium]